MGRFIIYALQHSESKRIYVGKTTQGMTRPRAHFVESNLLGVRRTAYQRFENAAPPVSRGLRINLLRSAA